MNYTSWIKQKLIENNLDKQILYSLYEKFKEETGSTTSLKSYKRKVRYVYEHIQKNGEDDFVDPEFLLKLESQKQKLQDYNNVVKKENRENYRLYNYLETIYQEYISVLKTIELPKINVKVDKENKSNKIGILHLSDLHMNELIFPEESFGNQFDFTIASKRLKKYITEAIKIFDYNNITTCYIFFTGDFINSNRRFSEKLAQSTSLVRASLLTTYLLEQCIVELATKYKVFFSGTVGNESRIDIDMESSDILLSENWDYLIYNNLAIIFENKYDNVKYIKPTSLLQNVISLPNGFNALLTHGHIFKSNNTIEKSIALLMQRYLYKGIPIHGVFFGHYHMAKIADNYAQVSSLCGGNSYSSNDLMYVSRASQNIYIINEDLSFNGIKIDLQNVEDIEGYAIVEELERYNIPNKLGNVKVTIENIV